MSMTYTERKCTLKGYENRWDLGAKLSLSVYTNIKRISLINNAIESYLARKFRLSKYSISKILAKPFVFRWNLSFRVTLIL